MFRRRILVVGPPGSGRAWLAQRVRAVTGMPVWRGHEVTRDQLEREREWILIVDGPEGLEEARGLADLAVEMATPTALRAVRLLLRALRPTRGTRRGLLAQWRRTRRWAREEAPELAPMVLACTPDVVRCASSERVRHVLEVVFGITAAVTRRPPV